MPANPQSRSRYVRPVRWRGHSSHGTFQSRDRQGAYRLLLATLTLLVCVKPLQAQLNQNCTVSVLNRTVPVNPDGSWVLPNIPANFGQVKARATCTQNGVTTFGESDFFTVPPNGAVNLPTITLGNTTPIPVSLAITPAAASLTTAGQTVQLAITATYPDGSTKDVTPGTTGTNYTISNPAIATITSDGLVTAVSSGTVVIQANNDGATGITTVSVVLGGATVGGIPVSWLLKYNLNPNDPLVPMEDPDRDGLTNLQEYQLGTDPTNPDTDGDGLSDGDEANNYKTNPLLADTDGDGIPDGVEIQTGSNPLDNTSYDLQKATAISTVTPPSFTLTTSISNPVLSVQLNWKVKLIDGKTTLDLTADPRTHYASSDLNICNFGQQPGLIFAGSVGACTVTLSQNTLSAPVAGTVTSFSPAEVSTLVVPGAVAVDIGGSFAYVATGTTGLSVVDVSDRSNPHVRGSLNGLGDVEGVRAFGQYALIADATGFLRIVNVQNPDAPQITASLAVPGKPIALAVHETTVAIAAQTGGVTLVSLTDPTNPSLLSVIPLANPALGVDFDPNTNIGAVAMGTTGLQVIDISNPAAPKLRGLLPGGDVRRVLLRSAAALLADAQRSITSVDLTNPDSPTLSSSLSSSLGGVPVDIAAFGNIAMTADITFGRAVPIVNVSDPLHPISVTFWTLASPGYSSSIAVDLAFGYLIIPATSTLRILKYQNIVDPYGIPPKISITAPVDGSTVIQNESIIFSANATDDVAVASVTFLADGIASFTTAAAPYQFQYTVPSTATMVTLGATAIDYGNNVGAAQNVHVNVIPDPLTTITGKVVDSNGTPVSGATITLVTAKPSTLSATTAADGTFSLSGVTTIIGNLQFLAQFLNPSGSTLAGLSVPTAPVRGGITNIGTITVIPIPIVDKLSVKSTLAGATVAIQVTGTTLSATTWRFLPASTPAIGLSVFHISQDGTSAVLTVTAPATVAGTFALVATNLAGDSLTAITPANRFTIVNPISNADTDGDGFEDAVEAFYGTDPLDPASIPTLPKITETESLTYSLLNSTSAGPAIRETESLTYSVLNGATVDTGLHETESLTYSLLNGTSAGPAIRETESLTHSVLNGATVSTGLHETESLTYSLLNGTSAGTAIRETESLTYSVLNGATAGTGLHETESLTYSVQNGPTTTPNTKSLQTAKPTTSGPVPSAGLTATSTAPATGTGVGKINYMLDSDGDGLPDWIEIILGTDPFNPDTDGDGISDGDEVNKYHTDPLNPDTDGDGLSDGEEILKYHTDPLKADTDGDGFSDGDEVKAGSDPLDPLSTPIHPHPAQVPQQIQKGENNVKQTENGTKRVRWTARLFNRLRVRPRAKHTL